MLDVHALNLHGGDLIGQFPCVPAELPEQGVELVHLNVEIGRALFVSIFGHGAQRFVLEVADVLVHLEELGDNLYFEDPSLASMSAPVRLNATVHCRCAGGA